MKLSNLIRKAQIASQLGSLAASVVLKGHDQEKNEEVTGKVNKVLGTIHDLTSSIER